MPSCLFSFYYSLHRQSSYLLREEVKLPDVWVPVFLLVDVKAKGPALTLSVKDPAVVFVAGKLGSKSLQLVVDSDSREKHLRVKDCMYNVQCIEFQALPGRVRRFGVKGRDGGTVHAGQLCLAGEDAVRDQGNRDRLETSHAGSKESSIRWQLQ